jgi:queuine tRNA-ribosyltransferase
MPVGTYGSVKGISPVELRESGAWVVLSNALHLQLRPGHEVIERLGGLHGFMGWDGPILTDSGGYQVFSMKDLRSLSEEGVKFRSPVDGRAYFLTPEGSVHAQEALGVDLAMAFDECIEWPADRARVAASTARTTRWLKRQIAARRRPDRTALLGIVQGGFYEDLRAAHTDELAALDLDAYAIGGISVGEPRGAGSRSNTPGSARIRALSTRPARVTLAVLSAVPTSGTSSSPTRSSLRAC